MPATRILLAFAVLLLAAAPADAAPPPGWTSLGKDFLAAPNPGVWSIDFDAENNGYALASYDGGAAQYREIRRPATGGSFTVPPGEEQYLALNPAAYAYDVDAAGRAVAVTAAYGSLTERHRFGDTWTDAQELATDAHYTISADFADDGSGVVAWIAPLLNDKQEHVGYDLKARFRSAAGTWGPTKTAHSTGATPRYVHAFQVAYAPDGAATIVWNNSYPEETGGGVLQVTKLAGKDEFESVEVVYADPAADSFEPVLTIDDDGNATILWGQWVVNGCQRVGEATRAPGSATFGEPTWPTVGRQPDSYYNCLLGNLRIAVAGTGDIAFMMTGGGYAVPVQTLSVAKREPGARFTEIPVLRDVEYQQYNPQLEGGPDGSFLLTLWGVDDANAFSGLETFLARPDEPFTAIGRFPGEGSGEPAFDRESTPYIALVSSEIVAFDDQGPDITALTAPDGVVGQELTFGFTASDDWSTVDSAGAKWTFSKSQSTTKEATGAAPKLTFTAAEIGTWTVSVEVADGNGNKTIRTGTFKIAAANQAPTAAFTVSPDGPKAQDEVTFNGSASADPDGDPLTFAWDFNDDGTVDRTGGDSTVVVKFPAGSYTAKLTVTDGRGGSATATKAYTVAAATAPVDPGPTLSTTPPAPGSGDAALEAAAAAKGLDIATPSFVIVSSRREREVPNVVGMVLDEAEAKLSGVHHIDYDIKWTHKLPKSRKKAKVGEVLGQEPKAGMVVDSGIGDRLKVVVTVYAGKKGAKGAACPAGFEKVARGIDWDLGRQLIAESCKKKPIDDLSWKIGKYPEPVIARVKREPRKIDVRVGLPKDPKEHDLFMIFRESSREEPNKHHTFNGDWGLVSNWSSRQPMLSCFRIQVFDRQKYFIQNATIELDLHDLDGYLGDSNPTFNTNETGTARICRVFPRRGTIDVVAYAEGRNGDMVFGASRMKIVDSPVKDSERYTTPSGRRFGKTGSAGATAVAAGRPLVARAAFWSELQKAASELVQRFQSQVIAATTAGVAPVLAPLYVLATFLMSQPNEKAATEAYSAAYNQGKLQPGNISVGGLLNADAFPVEKTTGRVWTIQGGIPPVEVAKSVGNIPKPAPASEVNKVIASGGGNLSDAAIDAMRLRPDGSLRDQREIAAEFARGGMVIASGGGNVIASGGGNVIASGGGNVIASGGGNLAAIIAGVIASGGGNVLSAEIMKNLIGQAGTNLIGQAGTNLIGEAGTNLTHPHPNDIAAGVIASGGGNVIASGGGNFIDPAQVVEAANKVIASGGGNFRFDPGAIGRVIASGGGNLIGEAGTNFQPTIIAEGSASPEGSNIITVGGGNQFLSTNGSTRKLASVAEIRRPADRRWVKARLAQTTAGTYGSVGSAADGEVLALKNYSGIAMSNEGASIFGNGEGITSDQVKDAARCLVLLIGGHYTLVEMAG